MNLKKYLKKADKVDLATYKLALECQINDTQDTINFLDKQIKKIELREASDIKNSLTKKEENFIVNNEAKRRGVN